ncbi:MAG: phosphatase PAP2 family protein [Opitutus sp.]
MRERLRSIEPLSWLNFAVLIGALAVFVFIAHEVADGDHLPLEYKWMRQLRGDNADPTSGRVWSMELARDITSLGSMIVLAGLTILVVCFLALSRRFGAALFLLIAAAGGQTVNATLKALYGRERPDPSLRWIEIDSLSFPSGHATSSAVIYLSLAVLLARLATTTGQKLYFIGAALFISFLVGLSRVYLGVHYPTDVVAGWAIGVAWAELCWFSTRAIGRRRLATTTEPGH